MCLIIDKVDGYIEESNGNRYVTLVSTDRNKVTLKNIENYGIKLKILLGQWLILRVIIMKNISKSNLIQMIICFYNRTIAVRSVFQKDEKFYLQVFLDEVMKYKMLEYDRIDASEGIDVNKTNASKE